MCPDSSNWLEDHYRNSFHADSFVAINVGCNKGYDALHLLRMGTGQETADNVRWKDALGPNVEKGVCNQESLPNLNLSGYSTRPGEVHCIEPMPLTAQALQSTAKATGLADKGFVVTEVAIANGNGTVYFPAAPMGRESWQNVKVGTENKGIANCGENGKKNPLCAPVKLMTLDEYASQHMASDRRINILMSDVEGYDFDVLLGGAETLTRTEYLEFEYNWKGPWNSQSLKDAVAQLDEKHFTCYWAGVQKLWRLTSCWVEHYSHHNWANVACVHRILAPQLASRMEEVFQTTLGNV